MRSVEFQGSDSVFIFGESYSAVLQATTVETGYVRISKIDDPDDGIFLSRTNLRNIRQHETTVAGRCRYAVTDRPSYRFIFKKTNKKKNKQTSFVLFFFNIKVDFPEKTFLCYKNL